MLLSEAKQILKKAGYLLEFTEGRYCIMNKNTGKYFTGVGANGKCFPWTDDIAKAHKNWGDHLRAVMDGIEHICMIEHDLKPSDLVIIDTKTGDEIEYEKSKPSGYWRFW
jgi:hypothetical protein